MKRWRLALMSVVAAACSGSPGVDAGFDAGVDAGFDAGVADAGPIAPVATMALFATDSDSGSRLQAFVDVNPGVAHDFDDGACTADRVRPRDGDAAWLRISGYAAPGQPILCTDEDAGYVCRFPLGSPVTGPAFEWFDAGFDPLGPSPILFATAGGADLGPAVVSVAASGRLTVREDLTTLPATLHPECAGCDAGHVLVKVRRGAAGIDCDFAWAPVINLHSAAMGLLPTTGPASMTVVYGVVGRGTDPHGGTLIGQTGYGVVGFMP